MTPSTPNRLPVGFEDFEPFVDWALPLESQRQQKRFTSTYAELQEFYQVCMAHGSTPTRTRIEEALHYLNHYRLGPDGATNHLDAPDEANRLFLISLAFSGVAHSVESYGKVSLDWVVGADRLPASVAADML
jgi:hypothetical protein